MDLILILATSTLSSLMLRRTHLPSVERQLTLKSLTCYMQQRRSSVSAATTKNANLVISKPDIYGSATSSASCVGIVGSTIAAGVGNLQGLHGLLIDSLLSVRLVIASGKIVTASAKENSNLFWAVRGAGSNFGVVTSATYKVYESTNGGQVVNADFLYPAPTNRSVWQALETFDSKLPAELAITAFVLANGTERYVCLLPPSCS